MPTLQVWEYEGAQTLGSFLRRRDCLRSLAADLEVPESAVVPVVMRHILQNLQVHDESSYTASLPFLRTLGAIVSHLLVCLCT